MKIDIHRSSKKPSYRLVIPAGTNLSALQGNAGAAVANLAPMTAHSTNVSLEDLFKGDLLAHLQAQIAAEGAGLYKTEVSFSEVVGD